MRKMCLNTFFFQGGSTGRTVIQFICLTWPMNLTYHVFFITLGQVRLDRRRAMISTRLEVEPRHCSPLLRAKNLTHYVFFITLGQVRLDRLRTTIRTRLEVEPRDCQELLERKRFSGTFFLGFWPEGPKPKEKNVPENLFLSRGFHRTDCQLVYMFDLADQPNISLCVFHYVRLGQVRQAPNHDPHSVRGRTARLLGAP